MTRYDFDLFTTLWSAFQVIWGWYGGCIAESVDMIDLAECR